MLPHAIADNRTALHSLGMAMPQTAAHKMPQSMAGTNQSLLGTRTNPWRVSGDEKHVKALLHHAVGFQHLTIAMSCLVYVISTLLAFIGLATT